LFKKIGSHKASGAVLVLGSKKTHKVEDGEMHQTGSNGKRVKGIRAGFTLVELLVVVAIIGLLVGLTIPAVFAALGVFNRAACKFEVNALSEAVEKYRSKYGDYPADGSSWPVMEAHLRKAFPNILISELNLLNPSAYATFQVGTVADIRNDNDTNLSSLSPALHRVMDPAEALVFFLGGFSSDAQRPFTGPGGPFVASPSAGQLQYNASRQNSFYDFPNARLTLTTSNGAIVSTDEELFNSVPCQTSHGSSPWNDLLPVFMSYKNNNSIGSPYVYFDSRTYQSKKGTITYSNFFQPSRVANGQSNTSAATPREEGIYFGAARPYLSEQENTTVVSTPPLLLYENKQTFQILSPGLDRSYGGVLPTGPSSLILFTAKGNPCVSNSAGTGFVKASSTLGAFVLAEYGPKFRPMADNVGNFTESNTLGENK
jgi:prepilin-type N-terminal cleavage/methylation domain-containing protein